ncbi:ring-1,2-phenylacetyl-CoA epoxidase subunit PaaD [Filimonas lacunae]|uniref:Ring-1,2-phenylacetyl-CoA epoxidase subunit PaaD n=2 Tax=Filimonas lacunae TaxID=477680 RepID=A0A173MPS8_9BACT|nr:phenylacetate-CoA oxygenase, PaaJ subunit [Filimonas lacunae]SIS71683.1 ring-1,2-phenylacetyl-CoA epoxidase subunit PaaD [Filimonas lacunae]
MTTISTIEEQKVWKLLESVYDPEVPVLTVLDLGIIRKLAVVEGRVFITITPTYSGCPAMDVISMQIRMALWQNGFQEVEIHTELSPAWTTDWMTEAGRKKLQAYGIAPPQYRKNKFHTPSFFEEEDTPVCCPRCQSTNTQLVSQFGSTACKALYQCLDCHEPFDYFKCH